MTMTGRGMNRFMSSLISRSEERSLGPVWYHPTIFSRAKRDEHTTEEKGQMIASRHRAAQWEHYLPLTFLNISIMPEM